MKKRILITFLLLFTLGCGDTFDMSSEVQPMYQPEPISEQDQIVDITIDSEIAPVKIKPTFIRKLVQITFGWVPLVGDILELPLDLVTAILPKFNAIEIANIPEDATINDPEVLSIIKSVQVSQVFLKVTPEEELPKDDQDKKCWVFFKCREPNLDFMKEIRIYIARVGQKDKGILIAKSNDDAKIKSKKTEIIFDIVENVNLKPIISKIHEYEIRTLVQGKPPKRNVYIQGGISLDVRLKISF